MEINGKTKVCGLIGNPVEHTLSPLIHNTLAAKLGTNMAYLPFLVQPEAVGEAVRGAYALNLCGLNVTVPYKSAVIPYLLKLDGLAADIGAVNTLVPTEGGYQGYNTDMSGLYRALQSEGIKLRGEDVILLGAGGAARAVAFMCAFYGASRVYLLNRTLPRAEKVAAEVNAALETDCILPLRLEDYGSLPDGKFLCIQGTSVGLAPNMESVIIEDEAFYQKVHTGYDLIYKPCRTKFMKLVMEHGGRAYHGLKMLLYQGIDAYELWNATTVSGETAAEIYEIMKKELGIYE